MAKASISDKTLRGSARRDTIELEPSAGLTNPPVAGGCNTMKTWHVCSSALLVAAVILALATHAAARPLISAPSLTTLSTSKSSYIVNPAESQEEALYQELSPCGDAFAFWGWGTEYLSPHVPSLAARRLAEGMSAGTGARGAILRAAARQSFAEAERLLDGAVSAGEVSPTFVYMMRGRINVYKGKYRDALAAYEQALASLEKIGRPDTVEIAFGYFVNGDYARAESLLQELLGQIKRDAAASPDLLVRVSFSMAGLAYVKARYDQAESLVRDAISAAAQGTHTAAGNYLLARLAAVRGRYAAAEILLQQAREDALRVEGAKGEVLRRSELELASLSHARGNFADADKRYREILRASEATPTLTAEVLEKLAALDIARGNFRAAGEELRRAVAIKRETLGAEHPSLISALSALVSLDYALGEFSRAGQTLQDISTLIRRSFGEAHPVNANFQGMLAADEFERGNYATSEDLYDRQRTALEKLFGRRHPTVAVLLKNLGMLLRNRLRYDEAEKSLAESVDILEGVLGNDSPALSPYLMNLGHVQTAQRKFGDAEASFNRALTLADRGLGAAHPGLVQPLLGLSTLNRAQFNPFVQAQAPVLQRAEAYAARAEKIAQESLGAGHPIVASCLNEEAQVLILQRRFPEAEEKLRRSLTLLEAAFGPDSHQSSDTLRFLAESYRAQGKYPEPYYKQAMAVLEDKLGTSHPRLLPAYFALAAFYYNAGRYEEAEELNRTVIQISTVALDPDSPDKIVLYVGMGQLLHLQGKYREAGSWYERSLQLSEKCNGRESAALLYPLIMLASTYLAQGEYAKIDGLHRRTVEIVSRLSRREEVPALQSVEMMEGILLAQGQEEEVNNLLQIGIQAKERILGTDVPDLIPDLERRAALLGRMDRWQEARPLWDRARKLRERFPQPLNSP